MQNSHVCLGISLCLLLRYCSRSFCLRRIYYYSLSTLNWFLSIEEQGLLFHKAILSESVESLLVELITTQLQRLLLVKFVGK